MGLSDIFKRPGSKGTRRVDTTTSEMLDIMAKCYKEPNTWHEISDHHARISNAGVHSLKHAVRTLETMIFRLGYEGFTIQRQGKRYRIMLQVTYEYTDDGYRLGMFGSKKSKKFNR
jgi:hypothetical protein